MLRVRGLATPAFLASNIFRDSSEVSVPQVCAHDFAGWRRPDELASENGLEGLRINDEFTMPSSDIDLVQDVTADCSVVASLCVLVARRGASYGSVRRLSLD